MKMIIGGANQGRTIEACKLVCQLVAEGKKVDYVGNEHSLGSLCANECYLGVDIANSGKVGIYTPTDDISVATIVEHLLLAKKEGVDALVVDGIYEGISSLEDYKFLRFAELYTKVELYLTVQANREQARELGSAKIISFRDYLVEYERDTDWLFGHGGDPGTQNSASKDSLPDNTNTPYWREL